MEFPDDMTLGEARALMSEAIFEGQVCPCCTRMAKVYKRKIHKAMAKSLVDLYKNGGSQGFVHWADVSTSGNLANFRHWGIIEEETNSESKRTGFWRITSKGKEFLKGEISVPMYSLSYDTDFIGLDDSEMISIEEALGEPFNLVELMNESISR